MRTMDDILQGEKFTEFIMKCAMDFKLWSERVIQNPTNHKEGLMVKDFHMEWFDMVHNHKRSCIQAPREHGKTLMLCVSYPLWLCFFNQFKQIIIISNTMEQSTKVLEQIKETIKGNEMLKKLLPEDRDAVWSRTEIHLSTKCKIICKPNNQNIRGSHVDVVLCVPKGTKISTKNGLKNIENIQVGDMVKTHKCRYKPVKKLMNRESSEKILEIITGDNKLRITKNHPLLVRRKDKTQWNLKWIPAGKLRMTDKLCYPLRGKIKSLRIPRKGYKDISDYFMVNEDVGRLFGLYAAEGSIGNNIIRFTFNSKEHNLINETRELIRKIFKMKTSLDTHNSWSTTVYTSSVALRKLFLDNLGKNSLERKIPDIIFDSPDTVKASFLKGWIDGDGTHNEKDGKMVSTSSKNLANDVKKLSLELGFSPSLNVVKGKNNESDNYRIYFSSQSMKIINTLSRIKKHRRFVYIPIKKITWKRNCSTLYNIEVEEDNSYIANGITVHNCDEVSQFEDKSVFWNAITPTVQIKDGHICAIGTPVSEYDLLADIMKNPAYKKKVYRAETKGKRGKIIPLWPEMFPVKKLRRIKEEIGSDAYKKEYMCDPIPDKTQIFKSHWIHECVDNKLAFMQPEPDREYYLGCDFAMSAGKKADYSVFIIVERFLDRLWIRHMERWKGLPHKTQETKIKEIFDRWNIKRALLDESTFGRIMTDNLKMEGYPVMGQSFTPVERHNLLSYLQNQFEKRKIVIPLKHEGTTRVMMEKLMEELSKFGYETNKKTGSISFKSFGTHDDTVIALALAVKIAGRQRRYVSHVSTGESEPKSVFSRKGNVISINPQARE